MRVLAEDGLEGRAVGVLTATEREAREREARNAREREPRKAREQENVHERALADTQRAFDGVASRYDCSNAANPILCAMRKRSRDTLTRILRPGSRVLDLGCGPGTDDVPLAQSGHEVTAIDWSPLMIEAARRRVREAGLEGRVRVEHLGIHQLDSLPPSGFDAARKRIEQSAFRPAQWGNHAVPWYLDVDVPVGGMPFADGSGDPPRR